MQGLRHDNRIFTLLAAGIAITATAAVALPGAATAQDDRAWYISATDSSGVQGGDTSGSSFWGQTFGGAFATGGSSPKGSLRPTLSKYNIEPMKRAIERYKAIVKKGGWKAIPGDAVKLKLQRGVTHPHVALLRARLIATGDMPSNSALGSSFDYYVERGLLRFQKRHGLKPTGNLINKTRRSRLGSRTLSALNISAKARLGQLRGNLQRLRAHVAKTRKGRYVVVNIPAQQVEAVDGDRIALRHTAVVGKKARATPLLSSRVYRVKFNPDWTLPPTVVREDLIPKGRRMQKRKQDVLKKFEIEAYTGGGRKVETSKINWSGSAVRGYRFRQPPGPSNPLGFVKIDFANPYAVYMHDTPSQRIFGRQDRAASSGCIRIQGIGKLVTWLLRDNTEKWSYQRVIGMKKFNTTKFVSLKRPVALHFIYVTAWATGEGYVSFRPDIYDRDRRYGVRTVHSSY